MGNGAMFAKEKPPFVRKEPLSTAKEVMNSHEAKDRIVTAIKQVPPGTVFRWDKVLPMVNRDTPPTEKEPDPMRVNLSDKELKETLKLMYAGVKFISSDGLALLRDYMPKLYNKHSIERGRRVSQRERIEKNLTDESFSYGELDHEIFATIYLKVTSVYGTRASGVFYDLGCGVGKLVYGAAFIGNFNKVVGIDNLACMIERGVQRQRRWDMYSENFTQAMKDCLFEFIEDNFMLNSFWTKEATFILLHWTAFNTAQQLAISKLLAECAEGTQVISFTNPIPGDDYEVLVSDWCEVSWGKAEFFFQEKLTPPRKKEQM